MTAKSESLPGTRNSPGAWELRDLLAALERDLVGGSEQVREEAILRLRDLGPDALPALPVIARAIGDTDELVVTKALEIFDRLCPTIARRLPELWSRLSQCDDKIRLAAVAELVRILPTLGPAQTTAHAHQAVKEDTVQQARKPSLPAEVSGKWIAWDENQEAVVAAADTYPELMQLIAEIGLAEPIIERAPGVHPALQEMPVELLEGESADILKDVRETIPGADEWLDTPNTRLWCKKPRDLIGTPQERHLRYLLRGLWSGITS